MRLVEDHGVIFGQNSSELVPLFDGQISEEQMVVDDNDVALERALVHQRDKAAVELRALLAGAEVAAGIQLVPGGARLRQLFDFGAIAELGGLLPFTDDLKVGYFLESRKDGFVISIVDLLPAGVIAAAFHVADLQWPWEMFLEKWNVLEEKLLLQVLGARGHDNSFTGIEGRHQIRQSFSGPRAGFDDEVLTVGNRGFDSLGHLRLPGTVLVIRMPLGKRAMPREELAGARNFGGSGHRSFDCSERSDGDAQSRAR